MDQCGNGWAYVVNIVGLVVGWLVVHRFSKQRDLERARRELACSEIDTLLELVDEIFEAAITYHGGSTRDIRAERSIKMRLQDLAQRLSALRGTSQGAAEITAAQRRVLALRTAATGSHFEDDFEGSSTSGEDSIASVTDAMLALRRDLVCLKHAQFP